MTAARRWQRRLAALACACAATLAAAQTSGPALDARLKKLETELRCLVCQNQTIADSAAGLDGERAHFAAQVVGEAGGREVRALAVAGKSDAEIKDYLVARYGDFVLYNPPVRTTTWLLWFGPLALLAGGGAAWLAIVRRRARRRDDDPVRDTAPPDDAISRAKTMLYEEP